VHAHWTHAALCTILQAFQAQVLWIDLQLKQTMSAASVTAPSSQAFNYTFSVRNLGAIDNFKDVTAYHVTVKDTFPVGIAPTTEYWIQPVAPGDGEMLTVADGVMRHACLRLTYC
jgi:hypothetical protein